MHTLTRIFIIAAMAAIAIWFGLSYGPMPGVRADIYMNLASNYRSIPDLERNRDPERVGITLLNANRIYYRISQSREPFHQVLDDYQKALTPTTFHLFSPEKLPNLPEIAKVAPELPFLEFLLNQKRIVREESSQWGLVSFLDMGPEANQDWHAVFRRKLEAFSRSGRLGDLGVAKTVVAVPNPVGNSTTVMSYWTDPDFNVRNLQDSGSGDLPGKDIEGFPRIQATRRLLTFEQLEERLGFVMVMYETPLTPEQAIAAYAKESRQQGWTDHEPEGGGKTGEQILFLDRGAAEAQLTARREGKKTVILVNYRIKS